MFVVILPKAVLVNGSQARHIGPFPSMASCQAWADTYEAEHGAFDAELEVEELGIPEACERLPVPGSNVVELFPVEPALQKIVPDPLPVKSVPSGQTRDPVNRDRAGNIVQRFFSDAQFDSAVKARSGLCTACGEMAAGTDPHYKWGVCRSCGNPYVWGTAALLAADFVLPSSKRGL